MEEMTMADFLDDFVGLTAKKKVMQEELKALNVQLEESGQRLLDELAKNGLDKVTGEFGTVYKRTTTHHSVEDKAKLVRMLTEAGYGNLVTVNSATLNSFIKELEEREGIDGYEVEAKLWQDLQPMVKSYEKTKPVLRKS